ncbi:MAG: TonB-dependent siderophore receptor [Verrucomicrobiota bacterium]
MVLPNLSRVFCISTLLIFVFTPAFAQNDGGDEESASESTGDSPAVVEGTESVTNEESGEGDSTSESNGDETTATDETQELDTTVVQAEELTPVTAPASPVSVPVVAEGPVLDDGIVAIESDFESLFLRDDAPAALKIDVPIAEYPRSVSIVSEELFQDRAAQNLVDTLVYTPGVTPAPFGFSTRRDSFLVRGVAPVVFVNGLRNLYDFDNNARTNTYALESVEVIKGPSSVLFGQGSVGGIINLTNKTAANYRENEVFASYGSFDRFQTGFDIGGGGEDKVISWRLVAYNRESDTQVDFVEDNSWFLLPSVTIRPGDKTEMTVLANIQTNEGTPAAGFLPWQGVVVGGQRIPSNRFVGEPAFDRFNTRQNSLTAILEHRFNDVFSVEARGNITEGNADYRQIWPQFTGSGTGRIGADGNVNRTLFLRDASSNTAAFDTRVRAEFETGAIEHNAAVGVDYQIARLDDDNFTGFGTATPLNLFNPVYGAAQNLPASLDDNPHSNQKQIGIYASDRLVISDKVVISIGGRWDDLERGAQDTTMITKDSSFTWESGILYKGENGVAPYFSYSESFLPVSLSTVDENGVVLDPTLGSQYEAGIKFQPEGTEALYTFAFFDILESNRPAAGNLPGTFISVGDVEIQGIEFEAAHQIGDFFFQGGYSYLTAINNDLGGLQLESVPMEQGSFWVSWRPSSGKIKGFKAGFGVRHVGDNFDSSNTLTTPEHTLLDAMVGYEKGPWDFVFNVNNLADREYVSTALNRGDAYYGARRYAGVTLRRKF